MRWPHLAAAASLLAGLPAGPLAAQPPPAQPGPAGQWVVAQAADLALLDKVTARTSMVTVQVGQATDFGALSIAVARCLRRPPEEPAEAAAWITVTDRRATEGTAPSFRGWMFATSPALNPLQHPVYDVRVLACK